jgi:glyoxylase-like metal-dependent hydrolase (beta-lactamase superfamily II)
MSLIQLTEQVHIFRGGVNFALITAPDKQLILIDSGLDSSNARKALRPFLEDGYRLAAILNTHSHADHIGGNADLVKRHGCEVWAPAKERPFILWPELEPIGLYGGALPPASLQVKFLQAQPTPAVQELPSTGTFSLAGVTMELVPVPGHSLQQVAVSVDGVLIAADAFFQCELIEKHPVIFLVNVAEYLKSMQVVAGRPERWVVPGHGDIIDRQGEGGDPLPAILEANRVALERLQAAILAAAAEPVGAEELLCRVATALGKEHDNDPSHFLDRAAVSAHITYLLESGRLAVRYEGGRRWLVRSGPMGGE